MAVVSRWHMIDTRASAAVCGRHPGAAAHSGEIVDCGGCCIVGQVAGKVSLGTENMHGRPGRCGNGGNEPMQLQWSNNFFFLG